MFDDLHHWFILGTNLTAVLDLVNDSAFGMATDVVVGISVESSDSFKIYDVYNLFSHRGEHVKVTHLADWYIDAGLSVALLQSKFNRRSNLQLTVIHGIFYKVNIFFFFFLLQYLVSRRL